MDGSKRQVALLAEGVDRNKYGGIVLPTQNVALLAEGVDRNRFAEEDERRELGRPPRGGRG